MLTPPGALSSAAQGTRVSPGGRSLWILAAESAPPRRRRSRKGHQGGPLRGLRRQWVAKTVVAAGLASGANSAGLAIGPTGFHPVVETFGTSTVADEVLEGVRKPLISGPQPSSGIWGSKSPFTGSWPPMATWARRTWGPVGENRPGRAAEGRLPMACRVCPKGVRPAWIPWPAGPAPRVAPEGYDRKEGRVCRKFR